MKWKVTSTGHTRRPWGLAAWGRITATTSSLEEALSIAEQLNSVQSRGKIVELKPRQTGAAQCA